jgi:ComF family protein
MCVICGKPFLSGEGHICGACFKKRPPFDIARAAGVYAGSLSRAIIRFKFNGKMSLAGPLGKLMAETLLKEFDVKEIDSIIPVPLHRRRLRWRGFNQSLLLARQISDQTGLWVDADTLKRIRHTTPQTRLPLKERAENVRGAFNVSRESYVKDRAILLVDDVFTSGSTILECSRALKSAGASRVMALTAAKAVSEI